MKVSVIIPAHNEERGLGASLEAVLRSEHPDLEVIVVDNASSDRTADVARQFPVRVLREERKGTMWACECGRQAATGEIIVRMDADCLPESDWIPKALSLFKNERVSAVSGPYDYYDGSPFVRWLTRTGQKYIYLPVHHILQFFRKGGVMMGGNSFFRASALRDIGGFNTDITFYGDDTDMAKRMTSVGRVIFTEDLRMKTSGRRLKARGAVKTLTTYIFHFFRVIFTASK